MHMGEALCIGGRVAHKAKFVMRQQKAPAKVGGRYMCTQLIE